MSQRNLVIRVAFLMVACALALALWVGPRSDPAFRMVVLDVGQGDAILLQTPDGSDVLVDGGPDGRVVERLSEYLPPSDRTLELVVLTHPDADHVGGLPAVAEHFKIERVLETAVRSDSLADRSWEAAIDAQRAQRLEAIGNYRLDVGGVALKVLWPPTAVAADAKLRNDTSVVLHVQYGETDVLLTGDISADVEQRLVLTGTLPDVEVLKVPHHGSISSSSEEFLDALKPAAAVISVGQDNRYGHPHPVVLRRYNKRGAKMLRTDEDGDVVMTSDGQKITFDN
ncbi:MAG: MBL fold metallo-hydrolase [Candidatus Kerfeldbacteria bacterium]|nr:MBL fold metallo-hydrolase [Candidatus Kerfeldbacteria bacterium]